MEDQILIKSKFSQGQKTFYTSIIVISFIVSVILLIIPLHLANSTINSSQYIKNLDIATVIFSKYYRGVPFILMICHWVSLLIAIILVISCVGRMQSNLLVTETRLMGKTSFGKEILIFVKDIVKISISDSSKIVTIHTLVGKTNFYLVENCREIRDALSSLLEQYKQ